MEPQPAGHGQRILEKLTRRDAWLGALDERRAVQALLRFEQAAVKPEFVDREDVQLHRQAHRRPAADIRDPPRNVFHGGDVDDAVKGGFLAGAGDGSVPVRQPFMAMRIPRGRG